MSLNLFAEDRERLSRKLKETPIADTLDGTAWAVKALHPADQEAVPRGMPTMGAVSMTNLQWQQEYKVAPPLSVGTTTVMWDADVLFFRHPVLFGFVRLVGTYDDGTTVTRYRPIYNRTLVNSPEANPFSEGHRNLADLCEQYRVSYAGLTAHLIANSTADQGAVTAAQYDWVPAFYSSTFTSGDYINAFPQFAMYNDKIHSYEELVMMPHTYTNEARHGAYMPLKLSETDEEWMRTNDGKWIYGVWAGSGANPFDATTISFASRASGLPVPLIPSIFGYTSSGSNGTQLPIGHLPGRTIGHMAFRGLDPEASLNLVFRVGVDMKVNPTSTYAPFQHNPPVHDLTALKMYYEIARRMEDAYPASYNATGDLMKVIMAIARELMPLVEPYAKQALNRLTNAINAKVRAIKGTEKPAGKAGQKPKGEKPAAEGKQ